MDIKRTVSINYHDIIHVDFEGFLDLISTAAVGHDCLMDISYELVGCDDDDLIFTVVGEVDFNPDELHVGDEVFWHDPDRGLCSSTAIIREVKGEGIFVVERENGCELEVFKHELS